MWPKAMIDDVLSQDCVELDEDFVGFTKPYEALSGIIPKHMTIVDLGCAYGIQSCFFHDHAAYIGVDLCDDGMRFFRQENSRFFTMGIRRFLTEILPYIELDVKRVFAIMNCVPIPDYLQERVRRAFPNIYCYYPSGEMHELLES